MWGVKIHVSHCTFVIWRWNALRCLVVTSSPLGQNGHYFTDDILKCIFLNAKFCISIRISLKFFSKGPVDNKSVLVQVMAWRRTGDRPLCESMLSQFTDAYMRHWGEMSLIAFVRTGMKRTLLLTPFEQRLNYQHKICLHWGRNKMAAILQMTFWNSFFWMAMHEFC